MTTTSVHIPAGLIDILNEAASVIGSIDPKHAPANMRFPIVDELQGFAGMLSDEAPSSAAQLSLDARPLTPQDVRLMRITLEDIYQGHYSEHFDHWMSEKSMAGLASDFAQLQFSEVCPEQVALRAIHAAGLSGAESRLSAKEMADIAKPFVGLLAAPSPPESIEDLRAFRENTTTVDISSLTLVVASSLEPFVLPGQRLLWQLAGRWNDEEGELPAATCRLSLGALAETLEYEVVADYGQVALVKSRSPSD